MGYTLRSSWHELNQASRCWKKFPLALPVPWSCPALATLLWAAVVRFTLRWAEADRAAQRPSARAGATGSRQAHRAQAPSATRCEKRSTAPLWRSSSFVNKHLPWGILTHLSSAEEPELQFCWITIFEGGNATTMTYSCLTSMQCDNTSISTRVWVLLKCVIKIPLLELFKVNRTNSVQIYNSMSPTRNK